MNYPGNDYCEAIDRVLSGLRGAEAPAGMEARILRNLETHAAGRVQTSWRNWFFAPAACAVALASVPAIVFFRQAPSGPEATRAPQSRAATAGATASPQSFGLVSKRPPNLPYVASLHVKAPASTTVEPEPVSEQDALALSEMLAPSKPAPPLPLTRQEKLMMRVLRHGAREEQLAMLDPSVRARDAAQSEADFHSFFNPPVPNDSE